MTNWKTTTAGVVTLVGSLVGLWTAWKNNALTAEIITATVTGVMAGIGLLLAKDKDVTGIGDEATREK